MQHKSKKVSCVKNPISLGIVLPTAALDVLINVVVRHSVRSQMDTKLHATDSRASMGVVVGGDSMIGMVKGRLVTAMVGVLLL